MTSLDLEKDLDHLVHGKPDSYLCPSNFLAVCPSWQYRCLLLHGHSVTFDLVYTTFHQHQLHKIARLGQRAMVEVAQSGGLLDLEKELTCSVSLHAQSRYLQLASVF